MLGLEKSPKHLGASKWVNQVFIIKNTSNGKVVFDYENLILPFRCYQTLIRKNQIRLQIEVLPIP